MNKFNLYGQLLANAALLPEPKTEKQLFYKRLSSDKDFISIKSKTFYALGSEDKTRIEEINVLNRQVNQIVIDSKILFAIIHKIVNP